MSGVVAPVLFFLGLCFLGLWLMEREARKELTLRLTQESKMRKLYFDEWMETSAKLWKLAQAKDRS